MSRSSRDRALLFLLRASAVVAGAIVLLIGLFLLVEATPILSRVGLHRFFSDESWHPVSGLYNLTPMLAGTMSAALGAVLVATPLGISSAIFCHFYAPAPLAKTHRRMIELFAGVPSVVYGLFGLVVIVPKIAALNPPGTSLLAAILILAIMVLPTVALVADAAIANVPKELLKGAAALGLGPWATVKNVVFPAARSGLYTGVILEAGRAIGETMAILMVAGNVVQLPKSIFDPIRTLTANIALEMAYATGDHRSALFVSGLLLLVMIVLLVIAVELALAKRSHA